MAKWYEGYLLFWNFDPFLQGVLIGKKKLATLPWKGSSKSLATEPKENGFLIQMLEERTLSMTKSFSMVVLTQSGNPPALEEGFCSRSQWQILRRAEPNLCAMIL